MYYFFKWTFLWIFMLFIFLVILDEASMNISVYVSVDRSTHFHLDICIGVKLVGHHFASKGPYSEGKLWFFQSSCMDVSVGPQSWAPKNWCFLTVVLEKTLESPWDCKEIKSVNLKKINPEYPLEELLLKLKPQNFGHLIWRADSSEKTGKDWGQRKKGTTEDEMVGWHHQLNEHEFEQIVGDSEGQTDLVCCSPWSHKASNMT